MRSKRRDAAEDFLNRVVAELDGGTDPERGADADASSAPHEHPGATHEADLRPLHPEDREGG